jgi:hypothetical protein
MNLPERCSGKDFVTSSLRTRMKHRNAKVKTNQKHSATVAVYNTRGGLAVGRLREQ